MRRPRRRQCVSLHTKHESSITAAAHSSPIKVPDFDGAYERDDTTYTIKSRALPVEATTGVGDNDTSVIRGPATMKAGGSIPMERCRHRRLMLSLLSGRRGQIESVHARKTKMTKTKETQYERTDRYNSEISGHDLLSRFEEYRKKRKKGTEKPHEGKLDLPQGRRVLASLDPTRLRAGAAPALWMVHKHRQLLLPHADHRPSRPKVRRQAVPAYHYYAERIHGLELPGMVLLEQINTIDKRRVKKYLGRMTRRQMDEGRPSRKPSAVCPRKMEAM